MLRSAASPGWLADGPCVWLHRWYHSTSGFKGTVHMQRHPTGEISERTIPLERGSLECLQILSIEGRWYEDIIQVICLSPVDALSSSGGYGEEARRILIGGFHHTCRLAIVFEPRHSSWTSYSTIRESKSHLVRSRWSYFATCGDSIALCELPCVMPETWPTRRFSRLSRCSLIQIEASVYHE